MTTRKIILLFLRVVPLYSFLHRDGGTHYSLASAWFLSSSPSRRHRWSRSRKCIVNPLWNNNGCLYSSSSDSSSDIEASSKSRPQPLPFAVRLNIFAHDDSDKESEIDFSTLFSDCPFTGTITSTVRAKDDDDDDATNLQDDVSSSKKTIETAAMETWNWCAHFVRTYNLCPFAEASVETAGALSLYMVPILENDDDTGVGDDDNDEDYATTAATSSIAPPVVFTKTLSYVADKFRHQLEEQLDSSSSCSHQLLDPKAAIAFCVFVPATSTRVSWDFESFNEWFVEIEEAWLDEAEDDPNHLANYVVLAPFHPAWQYHSDNDDDDDDDDMDNDLAVISLEKQTPYPTISIVSKAAIDEAGPTVTNRIARNNGKTLLQKSLQAWKLLYKDAVYSGCRKEE